MAKKYPPPRTLALVCDACRAVSGPLPRTDRRDMHGVTDAALTAAGWGVYQGEVLCPRCYEGMTTMPDSERDN